MKNCIICAIAMFMLASCASQNIDQTKVADTQSVEEQPKEKKSNRDCKRRTTGTRLSKRSC